MQECRQFLSRLFKDTEDKYILIWIYDGRSKKESHWFQDPESAAEFVEGLNNKINVYVGVGLSPSDYGPSRRCEKKNIAGIGALWLDMDIQDPLHKKPNLPPTIKDALAFLGEFPLSPTFVIHSGHGLQAWWILKEPCMFESEEERENTERTTKGFIYFWKQRAAQKGWDIDSVYNLDRVMRVPGTMNRKGDPIPVTIIEENDIEYNLVDFEDFIVEVTDDDKCVDVGEFLLDPTAQPIFDKFDALRENEPRFRQSWEHKRKDMQDQSCSAYDLSLATFAAQAGWSAQEIANLLIAHRRKFNEDLKLRPDYYRRTLEAAMKVSGPERVLREAVTMAQSDKETAEGREKILERLSKMWGFRVIQVIKYLSDPPLYRIVTERGNTSQFTVDCVASQNKLKNLLADTTKKFIPPVKREDWHNVAQLVLDASVDVPIGDESTEAGMANDWIEQYLTEKTIFKDPVEADSVKAPFIKDGGLYIYLEDFRKWIKIIHFENVTRQRLGAIMRGMGASPAIIHMEIKRKDTTRSVWRVKDL